MFVITVEFSIKADSVEPFLKEMLANARASREGEPGCTRFDVCVDPADRSRVSLYELYVDRAAFEAHLATAHFKAFDRAVAPWIESKAVKSWELLGS